MRGLAWGSPRCAADGVLTERVQLLKRTRAKYLPSKFSNQFLQVLDQMTLDLVVLRMHLVQKASDTALI